MICAARLAAPLLVAAQPGFAQETQFQTLNYICDSGVEIPATYVNAPDLSLAVINVAGTQFALVTEPAASGARYGLPPDAAGYVWWTKGPEATLYWREAGQEVALLSCKAQS